jgi:hypothetical protein
MSYYLQQLLIGALFAVLVFFSVSKLTESPPTWFDEGIYLQAAINTALHGAQELQLSPETFSSTAFVTGGFPFLVPISLSFKLFGIGLLQARAVMVLFLLGSALAWFYYARETFGEYIATWSLALLAFFPPLYGQGKNAIGEVPGLFFLAVFLWSVRRLEKQRYEGPWLYLLAGISAGLCISTKPIFFLLGGALLASALLYRTSIVWKFKEICIAALAFLVPCLIWLTHQFSKGDSAGQVLAYYANPYAIQDLNAQMLVNALRFVHETSPMYFAFLMLMWIASVALRTWRKRSLSIAESVAFLFALLVWIAFLRTAGWYRYFFVAEVVALVHTPNALSVLAGEIRSRFAKYALVAAMAALLLIQGYQLLFASWVAVHGERTTSHETAAYLHSLPTASSFFIYNAPAAIVFLPSQNYYQYLEILPNRTIGDEFLPLLQSAQAPDYLIINYSRWFSASSTLPKYEVEKDIDGLIVAKRRD